MGFLSRLSERAAPKSTPKASAGIGWEFAFIDFETTGLDPRTDRVLEVGIVLTDAHGQTIDEWSTLVNPGPGITAGATHIHGIETEWLAAAPPFSSLTHEIARRIAGRVVVAHNTTFDCNFLEEELRRLGHSDTGAWTSICTLDLADKLSMPKRLPALCAELGFPHETHDALGDARACAQVFHQFLRVVHPSTFDLMTGSTVGTVSLDGSPVDRVHRMHAKEATRVRPVLADLIDSLPAYDSTQDRDPAASRSYLALLEDAVADGYVSPSEVESLGAAAHHYGLSGEEVQDLNRELILGLIDRALDDRKISKAERDQISRIATWLGVDLTDWDAMVKASKARIKAAITEFKTDVRGKTVVFSGAGVHTSNIREAFAAKHGFIHARTVSATTDLVVLGTAMTETAQVAKAHEIGIPMMVEVEFWRRLGEL